MKDIASLFTPIERPAIVIRSAKEDIISQIVVRTTADKKLLAKRIALWVNRYKLDTSDLHALLKKADDPGIRNFTAFCQWAIKDAPTRQSQISANEVVGNQASA